MNKLCLFAFPKFCSGAISLRENISLNSFIKNNHQLEIYNYTSLAFLPEGMIEKDASKIITRNEYEIFNCFS